VQLARLLGPAVAQDAAERIDAVAEAVEVEGLATARFRQWAQREGHLGDHAQRPLAAEKQWKNIFEQAQGTVDTLVKGSTGDLEAITLGISFEEKGIAYYKKLSDESQNPLEKKFYQILSQEENRHFLILKDSQELLTDPSSWYEKNERIGLDGA